MSEPKIPALEDDAPIARKPRPYTLRRTTLYDAEAWNAMASPAPIRREIVPWASPDILRPGESGGRGCSES
jgi:hypothetical protein